MKKTLILSVAMCLGIVMMSCQQSPQWQLVWEENFNGVELDTTVWSMIPRGNPDWQNTMSYDERCYELSNGKLTLRGIINEDLSNRIGELGADSAVSKARTDRLESELNSII